MKFDIHKDTELPDSLASRIISSRQTKVLLLLPGGSFLKIVDGLFKSMLKEANSQGVDLDFLTITAIDERYKAGAAKHSDSNFTTLVSSKQVKALKAKGAKFHQILQDGLSLEDTAKEFDHFITNAIHAEETKIIGVLGVGTDYHLAGILPLKQEYYNSFKSNYVSGYKVEDVSDIENPHSERITLNFNGIMKLEDVSLYATGPNKYAVLRNLVAAHTPTIKEIADRPALFLHELKKDVNIYTDQQLFD